MFSFNLLFLALINLGHLLIDAFHICPFLSLLLLLVSDCLFSKNCLNSLILTSLGLDWRNELY